MQSNDEISAMTDFSTQSIAQVGAYFQKKAEELENKEEFVESINVCLQAIRYFRNAQNQSKVSESDIIQIQFHKSVAIARVVCLTNLVGMSEINEEIKETEENIPPTQSHLFTPNQHKDFSIVDDEREAIKQRVLNSVLVETPKLSMNDIVGCAAAKEALTEAIILPQLLPNTPFAQNAWKGILLFGGTGIGKTLLLKAVASESGMTFFNVDVSAIHSKWSGESVKNMGALFEIAREMGPSIIFFDECDYFCGSRNREENESSVQLKNKLLLEMDGFSSNPEMANKVIVVGNTNRPECLDNAFLRRFSKRVMIDLPTARDRVLLIKKFMADYTNELTQDDINYFAAQTEGYSGDDLRNLVAESGLVQFKGKDIGELQDNLSVRKILRNDVISCIRRSQPTNSKQILTNLSNWNDVKGNAGCSTRRFLDIDVPQPSFWEVVAVLLIDCLT